MLDNDLSEGRSIIVQDGPPPFAQMAKQADRSLATHEPLLISV
jgi:hypothetical protein